MYISWICNCTISVHFIFELICVTNVPWFVCIPEQFTTTNVIVKTTLSISMMGEIGPWKINWAKYFWCDLILLNISILFSSSCTLIWIIFILKVDIVALNFVALSSIPLLVQSTKCKYFTENNFSYHCYSTIGYSYPILWKCSAV